MKIKITIWKMAFMFFSFFLPYIVFFLSQGTWKNDASIFSKAGYTFVVFSFFLFLLAAYALIKKIMPFVAKKFDCQKEFVEIIEKPQGTLVLLTMYSLVFCVFFFLIIADMSFDYSRWRSGVYQANIVLEKHECKDLQRTKEQLDRSIKIATNEIADKEVIAYTENIKNMLANINCL